VQKISEELIDLCFLTDEELWRGQDHLQEVLYLASLGLAAAHHHAMPLVLSRRVCRVNQDYELMLSDKEL